MKAAEACRAKAPKKSVTAAAGCSLQEARNPSHAATPSPSSRAQQFNNARRMAYK